MSTLANKSFNNHETSNDLNLAERQLDQFSAGKGRVHGAY
jgi:hypothetical protein